MDMNAYDDQYEFGYEGLMNSLDANAVDIEWCMGVTRIQ